MYIPFTSKCTVQLLDWDGDLGSTYMCGYYFYPSQNDGGFPGIITLYNQNTWHKAVIDVYVTWVF